VKYILSFSLKMDFIIKQTIWYFGNGSKQAFLDRDFFFGWTGYIQRENSKKAVSLKN
jgi:hypothetical protein